MLLNRARQVLVYAFDITYDYEYAARECYDRLIPKCMFIGIFNFFIAIVKKISPSFVQYQTLCCCCYYHCIVSKTNTVEIQKMFSFRDGTLDV